MSTVGLDRSSYPLLQHNRIGFPSAAQEAEFLRLINTAKSSLKIEDFTPMHIAAILGNVVECKRLINSGWDPNEMGRCGFSPFLFVMSIFSGFSRQLGSENRNVGRYREIVTMLFDTLYAKGGIFNIRAQFRAMDHAFQVEPNSPVSLENTFLKQMPKTLPEEYAALFLVASGLAGCSGDEQIALNFLSKVHSKEEIVLLSSCCIKEWTDDALIRFWPKLSIQAQVILLDHILHIPDQEELFCKLWNHVGLEVKQAEYWMHDAVRNGKNKVIAFFLINNIYTIQCVDNYGRTVLHYATEHSDKIYPQLYQEMIVRDAGYSQKLFEARLFGHRFSLSGPFFEGANLLESRAFVSILANSIHEWSSVWQGPHQEILLKRMDKIRTTMLLATQSLPSDLLYERSKLGSVLILSGPLNHAIDFIFHKDQLVKIDTGVSKKGGMKFYEITNFEQEKLINAIELLQEETLEEALKKLTDKGDLDQLSERVFKKFWAQIKRNLGLQRFSSSSDVQTVGNCAWEAHKTAVFALVFLDLTRESGLKSSDNATVEEACSQHFSFRRNWIAFDCAKGFREGFPIVSQLGFDVSSIFSHVLQNCLLQSGHYCAKIEQPIIDILTIEPAMNNWVSNSRRKITLFEFAQSVKLDNVCIYLKLLGRINGPPRITYESAPL